MLQSSSYHGGTLKPYGNDQRGGRCGRKGRQLLGQLKLCILWAPPQPRCKTAFPIFTRPKSARIEKPFSDLLSSLQASCTLDCQLLGFSLLPAEAVQAVPTALPGSCCCTLSRTPHSATARVLGQAVLHKKGDSALLPHLVKGLISSAFGEGIYMAEPLL